MKKEEKEMPNPLKFKTHQASMVCIVTDATQDMLNDEKFRMRLGKKSTTPVTICKSYATAVNIMFQAQGRPMAIILMPVKEKFTPNSMKAALKEDFPKLSVRMVQWADFENLGSILQPNHSSKSVGWDMSEDFTPVSKNINGGVRVNDHEIVKFILHITREKSAVNMYAPNVAVLNHIVQELVEVGEAMSFGTRKATALEIWDSVVLLDSILAGGETMFLQLCEILDRKEIELVYAREVVNALAKYDIDDWLMIREFYPDYVDKVSKKYKAEDALWKRFPLKRKGKYMSMIKSVNAQLTQMELHRKQKG